MKLLEVVDFGIEFHDHDRPEQVVEGVNFSLEEGEILGIVGESGSGKSMTALAIAGLLPRKKLKKEGHIYFEGKDVLRMDRAELRELQGDEICMIFQEPQSCLNPVMRIGPQVEEALRGCEKDLTVAVMGCIVNGPGEARQADVGIAGGDGCGVLFVKGELREKMPYDELLDALLSYIDQI